MLLAIKSSRYILSILTIIIATGFAEDYGGCDYYYPLPLDRIQVIENEEYPELYKSETKCRWKINGAEDSFIYLACTDIEIPRYAISSINNPVIEVFRKELDLVMHLPLLSSVFHLLKTEQCKDDKLIISSTGFADRITKCGSKSFDFQSQGSELDIELIGKIGGRFTCTATAMLEKRLKRSTGEPDCACGQRQILASADINYLEDRIVSGDDALPHEFPFFIAFTDTSRTSVEESQFCGGSIISPKYVLTAAHCFHNREIENLRIVAGAHNISDEIDSGHRQIVAIEKAIIHEEFDLDLLLNDIAIAVLKEDLVIDEYVSPVCLPFNLKDTTFLGETITAVGWGQKDFSEGNSNILQKVHLEISQCFSNIPTSIAHICTFSNEGKDTCIADSGGPILYINSDMKVFVIGLVSYGEGCGGEVPSINTRVTEHLDWIVKQTPDAFYCIV